LEILPLGTGVSAVPETMDENEYLMKRKKKNRDIKIKK
jgi:hypothetical protein